MIKLKSLLESEGKQPRSLVSSKEIALHNIKTNYSNAIELFKSEKKIYRGYKGRNVNFLTVDPTIRYKPSKETNNLYVAIMESTPNYRGFPRRSRSIIFSTKQYTASTYGDVYFVFLENDAISAISNDRDFWGGMHHMEDETGINGVDSVMIAIRRLVEYHPTFDKTLLENNEYTDQNIELFFEEMKKIDEPYLLSILNGHTIGMNVKNLTKKLIEYSHDRINGWKNYFYDVFDPIKNDITIANLKTLPYGNNNECWSESRAILILDSQENQEIILSL